MLDICKQAQACLSDQLSTMTVCGAYFWDDAGKCASTVSRFFTPNLVRHDWVILTTVYGSIFCLQFTRGKIKISVHGTREAADQKGMDRAGATYCEVVYKENPTRNCTIQDLITFLELYEQKYKVLTNNCQTLALDAFKEFAIINIQDEWKDAHDAYRLIGLTRHRGGYTATCNVM